MYLKNSKTVAVKIGSSLLIDDNMKIRTKWLVEFSKDIKKLTEQGKKIIIIKQKKTEKITMFTVGVITKFKVLLC